MTTISRRALLALFPAGLLAACTSDDVNAVLGGVLGPQGPAGGLTAAEAAAGIRAALDQGIGTAIAQVGRQDGYFGDSLIRIPLPQELATIQSRLAPFGLSGLLDELELQLNRGAERAAPEARSIFVRAVRSMTISDALGIVRGPDTAATDYFRRRTTGELTSLFTPVMENALEQTGAIQTFDRLVGRLRLVPFAPRYGADAKQGLVSHGVSRGLDGLFVYIAREEQAIRQDPARRTSEILRRVFG